MSVDGTGNKKKPPPPIIVNPYARKRKDPPSSSITNPIVPGNVGPGISFSSSSSLASPSIDGAATFSQAFASIDETVTFKTQHKQAYASAPPDVMNPQTAHAQAEQRALDQAEKSKLLSDRDHHALLQQPHVLYVSTRQRGNGILKHIRNVPYAFSKMVPDYIMSTTSCALFLSLKYHRLYPDYIHRRIAELSNMFKLRVLLALVDVDDNTQAILKLNKIAVSSNLTLILAWSEQEAARYLEVGDLAYKAFDGKDASSIQKREQTNFVDQVADFLTASKPVNKTDSTNLLDHFSTIRAVAAASKDELALCPGLGQVKVNKLYDAFHKPFSSRKAEERRKKKIQEQQQQQQQQEASPVQENVTEAEDLNNNEADGASDKIAGG